MPKVLIMEVEKFVSLSGLFAPLMDLELGLSLWLRCSHEGGESIAYILHTSLIITYRTFTRDLRLDPAEMTVQVLVLFFYMYISVISELDPLKVFLKKIS